MKRAKFSYKIHVSLPYFTDMRITFNVMLMFAFGVYCEAVRLHFLDPNLSFSPIQMAPAETVGRHIINKVCLLCPVSKLNTKVIRTQKFTEVFF